MDSTTAAERADPPQGSGGIGGDEGTTTVQRGFLRRLIAQVNALEEENEGLRRKINGLKNDPQQDSDGRGTTSFFYGRQGND